MPCPSRNLQKLLSQAGHAIKQLLQAGESSATLPMKINAILNRWLVQEASITAYHDMFVLTAAIVLLAVLPVLWLRSRRVTAPSDR